MKKCLCLACILIVAAVLSMPFAFRTVDAGREAVVITEQVIAGDSKAAEGVELSVRTQWDGHLLWETRYDIGSGKTETDFSFNGDGEIWEKEGSAYFDLNVVTNFGTAVAVGMQVEQGVHLEDMWLTEILEDVASRTEPGKVHTEQVKMADYYTYYPIHMNVLNENGEISFYSDRVEDYFADFFHVRVSEADVLTVTITKSESGVVTAVDCTDVRESDEGKICLDTAFAFGEEGCIFTYACADWVSGERVNAGENTGIFYVPYIPENRRKTLDYERIEKMWELPEEIVPGQMLWNEETQELFVAATAGREYRLYVYSLKDIGSAPQVITVLDREESPFFREMTMEEGGILLKWSDGSFSFVTGESGVYELWCSNVFEPNAEYQEAEDYLVGRPQEVMYGYEIFSYEHALAFDGERMVLASFDNWETVGVMVAVYDRNGQLYLGKYHHSAQLEECMSGLSRRVYPQGTKTGSSQRKLVEIPPLELKFK